MKKPINEIAKMRRIAGLITESEYQEALQEENSAPSKQLRQIVLKYIKPEYHDKVENTYDRYINFLKAYTKPVTGKDRKGIYPAIIKNLVKVKSINPSEILNHYKVENLDLLGDLMFKTPDVALSILKKLDKDKITESEYQEALQEEKGLVKVGEKVLSQDKKPYWADENLNTIDTKTLTTYTKGDYNIEVVESQFYFEGDEENKISFSVSVKVFKDENLIKKKLFYPGAERWKGMSIEDFIDYTTQLINGDVNEYQEAEEF